MKLIIDIPEETYGIIKNINDFYNMSRTAVRIEKQEIGLAIKNGTPLEEIPNPCIECSQNCCVRELNGEKCECQKVYVVKENKE